MPQMAPLMWLSLFFIFILTFLMFNILNYFNFVKFNKLNLSNENKMFTFNNLPELNWKW